METELLNQFKMICQLNDELLKEKDIMPMFFIINKKHEMQIIACPWKTGDQKEKAKNIIMKMIANSELLGYIMISDTNLTEMDIKGIKKPIVKELCIRTLYTKDEVIRDWVEHVGKSEFKKFDTSLFDKAKEDKDALTNDQWNFWTRSDTLSKEQSNANKDYFEFKRKNPQFYK